MSGSLESYGIASYVTQHVLIVPFQADFYVEIIAALRQDILSNLSKHAEIKGLIIDLSKVVMIDLADMKSLEETLKMAEVLGVTAYLTGIRPSVTLALIDLGYNPIKIKTALTIEQAIVAVHASRAYKEKAHKISEKKRVEVIKPESQSNKT